MSRKMSKFQLSLGILVCCCFVLAAGSPSPVVTLGDSYSSGVGVHLNRSKYEKEKGGRVRGRGGVWLDLTPSPDRDCWRDTKKTPGPRYAKSKGRQSLFYACSGAKIEHILNQFDYLNFMHPEHELTKWQGATIMFTIGGNDVQTKNGQHWSELIGTCITSWGQSCARESKNQPANFDAVQADLKAWYQVLADKARNAQVRVMGYPRMFRPKDDECGVLGLSGEEAAWIDSVVDMLNSRIAEAIAEVKEKYTNFDIEFVEPAFTNGACSSKKRKQVNSLVWNWRSSFVSAASFHPTRRGYKKYFKALKKSLT